jgi:hypothetical protein
VVGGLTGSGVTGAEEAVVSEADSTSADSFSGSVDMKSAVRGLHLSWVEETGCVLKVDPIFRPVETGLKLWTNANGISRRAAKNDLIGLVVVRLE